MSTYGWRELVDRIAELSRERLTPLLVAIDGRSGAGKSILAAAVIAELEAAVIDGDDFYSGGSAVKWDAMTPAERVDHCMDWRRQLAVLETLCRRQVLPIPGVRIWDVSRVVEVRLQGETPCLRSQRGRTRSFAGRVVSDRVSDHQMYGRPDVESISAVTLATHDMARSIGFYTSLGLELLYGGPDARFSSFAIGDGFLNLMTQPMGRPWSGWGRLILHVSDVDTLYQKSVDLGLTPEASPRNGEWGERYFHLTDPDGHSLSFARPLKLDSHA